MAESSICWGMVETEIEDLKETIFTQQQLLQKLYIELDEEREASATATSEALSMILRLQGEKALEKMEASQYKRMAEEKMYHAEESLAGFEELMYQKEMEIASLQFQVQAYRCKLLSMDFNDQGIGETRFPEHLFCRRNEAVFGDMGIHGTVRRNNSLPAIQSKDSYHKKGIVEREGYGIPPAEMFPRKINEDTGHGFIVQSEEMQKKPEEFAIGDFNSYWEQIKQLDERVKVLSSSKDVERGLDPDPTRIVIGSKLDCGGTFSCSSSQAKYPMNLLETEAIRNETPSSSTHDIFEVPQINVNHKHCGPQKKDWKVIAECENRLGKPDSVKDEADRLKKVLLYAHHQNKLSKPKDGVSADCHLDLVGPTIGDAPCKFEVQQLNKRLEILEDDRRIMKKETADRREEELKLMKEIHEQLNTIQSHIRSSEIKKFPPTDESHLVSIMEAMLFYSL